MAKAIPVPLHRMLPPGTGLSRQEVIQKLIEAPQEPCGIAALLTNQRVTPCYVTVHLEVARVSHLVRGYEGRTEGARTPEHF